MQVYELNESFKALVREALPQKSRALDDIKSEFATKDFVRAEIVKSKIEIIKWVFGIQLSIGALIVAILKFL